MNFDVRKINLINWLTSVQDEDVLAKIEKIQKEKYDWWDSINENDKKAISEGLNQLDKGDYLTRSEVRSKIKERFKF